MQKYPELSRDREVCNKILEVLRDYNNDKSIPLRETISGGSSSSDEEPQKETVTVETTQLVEAAQEEKQANDMSVVLKRQRTKSQPKK